MSEVEIPTIYERVKKLIKDEIPKVYFHYIRYVDLLEQHA